MILHDLTWSYIHNSFGGRGTLHHGAFCICIPQEAASSSTSLRDFSRPSVSFLASDFSSQHVSLHWSHQKCTNGIKWLVWLHKMLIWLLRVLCRSVVKQRCKTVYLATNKSISLASRSVSCAHPLIDCGTPWSGPWNFSKARVSCLPAHTVIAHPQNISDKQMFNSNWNDVEIFSLGKRLYQLSTLHATKQKQPHNKRTTTETTCHAANLLVIWKPNLGKPNPDLASEEVQSRYHAFLMKPWKTKWRRTKRQGNSGLSWMLFWCILYPQALDLSLRIHMTMQRMRL